MGGTTRVSARVRPQGPGLVEAGRPIAEVAQALGISDQSIDTWRRQDRIDRGLEPGLTSGEKAELGAAKRRIAELETELQALRRAMELVREVVPPRRFQAAAVMAADGLPVEVACRVLDASTSGSDALRSRPPWPRAIRHAWLTDLISQASGGTYGGLGVHAELRLGRGMMVGHNAVALLMRRAGLAGATGRPKWGHAKPDQIAAELVDPQLHPSEPNQLWVTDITEHPPARPSSMCGGAGCLLPSGGRLVDRCHPTAALVTNALGMAIQTPTPPAGAVIHSDQACRSPPGRVHPAGQDWGLVPSMGRSGLLRQRHDRGVLVAPAGRAAEPAPLEDPGGAGQRDRCGPGELPQPATPPQQPRHADPETVRAGIHHGMRIQPPGSTKPGAQHYEAASTCAVPHPHR